jgi:hypothetical protein
VLRFAIALSALITTGCLRAASCNPLQPAPLGSAPSRLDYLLLASLADSPQLLSMAAYQPIR